MFRAVTEFKNKTRVRTIMYGIWIFLLYCLGLFLWSRFLNFGDIHFTFLDWGEDSGPRLVFLQNAIKSGVLPLHMSNPGGLSSITDRFISIPDVILSPQVFLLNFLYPEDFILFNTLLQYSIGFVGLLFLRKKFSLSAVPFTILFFIFNFNGHVLAHHAVGHVPWGGYFLLSWFVLQVFRLLDKQQGWLWITQTALLIFIIFLQGSFHQFMHCVFFLLIISLTGKKYFWQAIGAFIASGMLSLIRILPTMLVVDHFNTVFHGGFPTFQIILEAFTNIQPANINMQVPGGMKMGWWEFDFYIGITGLLFILFFGFYRWVFNKNFKTFYPQLLLPIVCMTIFSLGTVFKVFTELPIPLGERVTTRFIVLPLLFLCTIAVVKFDRWLKERNISTAVWLVIGTYLLIMVFELWQHFKVWQLTNMFTLFEEGRFVPSIWYVDNYRDIYYTGAILVGAVGSIVTLAALIYLSIRSTRREKEHPPV